MDLINIGKEARKTGFKPREGLPRDQHDMEDIDEFFADGNSSDAIAGTGLSTTRHKSKQRREFSHESDSEADSSIHQAMFKSSDERRLSPKRESQHSHKTTEKNVSNKETSLSMIHSDNSHYDALSDAGEDAEASSALTSHREALFTKKLASNRDSTNKVLRHLPSTQEFDNYDESENLEAFMDDQIPQKPSDMLEEEGGNDGTEQLTAIVQYDVPLASSDETEASDDDYYVSPQERCDKTGLDGLTSLLPSPPPESKKLRRSKRTRVKPLDFWKNERIIYTRADEDFSQGKDNSLINDLRKIPLQEITEIIHVKDPEPKTKKRKIRANAKKKAISPKIPSSSETDDFTPQWFQDGAKSVNVYLEEDKKELLEVAWAPDGYQFQNSDKASVSDHFSAAPIYESSSGNVSAGLIEIPCGGFKDRRSSSVTSIFHVIDGRIEVELNEDRFVVLSGCSFVTPFSNVYSLRNVGLDTARIFFTSFKVR